MIAARKNGQTIYAETCPQYLLLHDSVYSKPDFQGAVHVCAPPIRKKEDQDCLWKALADGADPDSSHRSVQFYSGTQSSGKR